MKSRFLFPYRAQYFGVLLTIVGLLFHFYSVSNNSREIFVWQHFHNSPTFLRGDGSECFDDEIQFSLILIGLILIASAKEKIEDEQISALRLESLQWAVYLNYLAFFILIFSAYGISFLTYSLYNVLTLLIIFIIRFKWKIYRNNSLIKEDAI